MVCVCVCAVQTAYQLGLNSMFKMKGPLRSSFSASVYLSLLASVSCVSKEGEGDSWIEHQGSNARIS